MQCWVIGPQGWVEFELLTRTRAPRLGGDEEVNGNGNGSGRVKFMCTEVVQPTKETLETTYLGYYQSSPNVHRGFCTRCGTSLTYASSKDRGPSWTAGPIVDVAVGTLDQESIERVRPERHGWWNHGVSWVREMIGEEDWVVRHPGSGFGTTSSASAVEAPKE